MEWAPFKSLFLNNYLFWIINNKVYITTYVFVLDPGK